MMSPSSRGRGLKLLVCTLMVLFTVSPSSRGRGLKYNSTINIKRCNIVALFTRAWIEIEPLSKYTDFGTRRPLHEGVD